MNESIVLKATIIDYLRCKEDLIKKKKEQEASAKEEETNSERSSGNYGTMVFHGGDSDNFSTMVVNSEDDNFSTMVVQSTEPENFSTMMINNETPSGEQNSYAAAIQAMQQSSNTPNITQLSSEVQQIRTELAEFRTFVTGELQSQKEFLENTLAEIRRELKK